MNDSLNDDPGLIGLSGLDPATDQQTPYKPPADDDYEADADVSSSILAGIQAQRSPVEATLTPSTDRPGGERDRTPEFLRELEIPNGSILSSAGLPFEDFDAASHKATTMSRESSLEFHVRALSSTHFVVFPQTALGTSNAPLDAQTSVNSEAERASYRDLELSELSLSDFPEEHAVHKAGLPLYKRYLKKNFKFKPAYRSMFLIIALIPLGALMYLFPNATLLLLPAEMVSQMVASMPIEKLSSGVAIFGLVLAVASAARVFWIRQVNRYTLKPNYVEYAEGILFRKTSKIPYLNILNHECNQNPIQLFLNYGTLELASAASDGAEILIGNIYYPRLVEAILEDNIIKSRKAMH